MKLLIAGSRSVWPSLAEIDFHATKLERRLGAKVATVISGCARGADHAGECWARYRLGAAALERYPAAWAKHGRRAGLLRNLQMVIACDAALVFWDGSSKGTAHTIGLLRQHGKPLELVERGAKT